MELNFKNRYKAFTLWEMMIALLITSLIVTLSYGTYRTFTDVLKDDEEMLDGLYEMMILDRDLYRLADSCVSMVLMEDVLYFNHRDSYSYIEFGDSILIWGEGDGVDERIYQLTDWSVEFLDEQSNYIKAVQLNIVYGKLTCNFSLKKIYPRTMLYSMTKE